MQETKTELSQRPTSAFAEWQRNKINELEKAAAYMQQAAQNQQTQSGPTDANYNSSNSQSSGSSSKDDDVIDADFTDKK